ncbi:MAG TPA: hypothetical protein VIU11_09245 [Nakamurella sp.]
MTIHLFEESFDRTRFDRTRDPSPGPRTGLPAQGGRRHHVDPPVIVDLVPGDTATIRAVFAGLSPQSRYRRFQTARPDLPAGTLRRLADVRPGHHVVHVALLAGRPVGLVRWIRWGDARSAIAGGIEFFLVQLSAADDGQRRRLRRLGGRPDPTRPGLHLLPVGTLLAMAAPEVAGPADVVA